MRRFAQKRGGTIGTIAGSRPAELLFEGVCSTTKRQSCVKQEKPRRSDPITPNLRHTQTPSPTPTHRNAHRNDQLREFSWVTKNFVEFNDQNFVEESRKTELLFEESNGTLLRNPKPSWRKSTRTIFPAPTRTIFPAVSASTSELLPEFWPRRSPR